MELYYHRRFRKQFQKLDSKLQKRCTKALEQLKNDHHNPHLRNHPLHGDMSGRRSISVGGDLRIIFRETNNYQYVTLLDVGTHNQVY